MALWPFGKKNEKRNSAAEAVEAAEATEAAVDAAEEAQLEQQAEPEADAPDPVHDAITGDRGPFDGDTVSIDDFDFSDFSTNYINLGSLIIALPKESEIQVEMGPEGPKMLHILTKFGRVTPVAFAAPASAGQWRETTKELAEGMRNDGLNVSVEHGPWGRELVGSAEGGGGIVRIIGVDGPRWMLRMTMAAPLQFAEEMTEMAREITARTFVMRGSEPILAGNSLPVALPAPLAEQVRAEMQRRQEAAQQQAQQAEEAQAEQAEAPQETPTEK